MDNLGVIPARLESTRFPRKILAPICGKPMIEHVWAAAKSAKLLDEVIIACDDEMVCDTCVKFGARAQMTAKAHLSGTDRIAEVVNSLDCKNVINIQADEPLIKAQMIDSLVSTLINEPKVYMATLAKRINPGDDISNPNMVKVVKDKFGWALYFSRSRIPYYGLNDNIDRLNCFKHIGIYAYSKDFLFTFKKLPVLELEKQEKLEQLRVLENGYRIKIVETNLDTLGVDTLEDLKAVEQLLSRS